MSERVRVDLLTSRSKRSVSSSSYTRNPSKRTSSAAGPSSSEGTV